jgi:hypothetical protein
VRGRTGTHHDCLPQGGRRRGEPARRRIINALFSSGSGWVNVDKWANWPIAAPASATIVPRFVRLWSQ